MTSESIKVLTVYPTAVTDKPLATAVGTDYLVISDTSDGGKLKKVLVSDLMVGSGASWGSITGTLSDQTDLQTELNDKQDILVSATNIKTINGNSILGSGDMTISGGLEQYQARRIIRR